MTTQQFEREKDYSAASLVSQKLLMRGIISASDKRRIDRLLLRKYRPPIGSLYDARGSPKDKSVIM